MVAILAPRVQVPDLKGLGPSDRKTGGLVSTLQIIIMMIMIQNSYLLTCKLHLRMSANVSVLIVGFDKL